MRDLTFFQSWNYPTTNNWEYICFTAKSRAEAEKIGQEWINWKLESDYAPSETRLLSKTESKKWKRRDGTLVFKEIDGRLNFQEYQNLLGYKSRVNI